MFEALRIEESPQRMPGYCRGCRATSLAREWIMDLDIDDEDRPGYAIQLCNVCVQTLAEFAGYQKFEMIQQMNVDRMEELEEENRELRNVSRVLGLLGLDADRLISVGILAGISPEGDEQELPGEVSPDAAVSSGTDRTASNRSKRANRVIKSTDDTRLAELRGSDDDKSNLQLRL